jgi:hypothetical protein
MTSDAEGKQFLTVDKAALVLGQNRLRVREAIARGQLQARRDNEGRMRVDLTDLSHVPKNGAEPALAPDAMLGLLFDEIEELDALGADRDAHVALLTDLVARQADAIEQADVALSIAEQNETRLTGLLDRALAHLEQDANAAQRMAQVTDRAVSTLDSVGDDLEASLNQTAQFQGLLNRALDLAESGQGMDVMGATADHAMQLLEDAVRQAEAGQVNLGRTADILDRALAAGEQMKDQIASQKTKISEQNKTINTALSVSERAMELAAKFDLPKPARQGFWRRLLRI